MSEFFNISDEQFAVSARRLGFEEKSVDTPQTHLAEGRAVAATGIDKCKYIEILTAIPGVDPVLAVMDDHPEDIPVNGWLVHADVAPGYGGVIELSLYREGGIKFKKPEEDHRDQYHEARVDVSLSGGYVKYTLAYENPDYPYKEREPFCRMSPSTYTGMGWDSTEVIDLGNGGRLLNQAGDLRVWGASSVYSLDWRDYFTPERRNDVRDLQVNRVVLGHEELGGVVLNLGFGMGLENTDVRMLLETVAGKVALLG